VPSRPAGSLGWRPAKPPSTNVDPSANAYGPVRNSCSAAQISSWFNSKDLVYDSLTRL